MKRRYLFLLVMGAAGLACLSLAFLASESGRVWELTAEEYFDSPGASVLVFHDYYPEGKQGGIEIIQHGERVAACGDVRLEAAPGQWATLPTIGKREVDRSNLTAKVSASFTGAKINYAVRVRPEGEAVRVSVDLERPLPSGLAGRVSFNLELFPAAYFGKTFHLGGTSALFPRQANGPVRKGTWGLAVPVPLARGPKLTIAPEDTMRKMIIECLTGGLELIDGRNVANNGWFVVRTPLAAGSATGAVEWLITPHRIPGWQREPVIAVSQVGYHPGQVKRAVIELDRRSGPTGIASLYRIKPEGRMAEILSAPTQPWNGKFLRYNYSIFDFTEVREPGIYIIRYGPRETPPFRIGPDVYKDSVWQPTLETYLPVQMCHIEVRDVYRLWHGVCHLDDAVQAPPSTEHFDSYRQGPVLTDRFAAFEHIPFLDRGGWHDAGDLDLAAGSQAITTFVLALARETFGIDTDQTTINKAQRRAVLHSPDGFPDILQQIEHGAESLLSGYRAAGHSFGGIIEGTIDQYILLGDAASMTDGRIYDATLQPAEVKGERSGWKDDRWAFTNRDTSLEYAVIVGLAAAARTLKGYNDVLAAECLETALKAWEREQGQPPVSGPAAYVPGHPEIQEVLAAAELLITTKEGRFHDRLLSLLPVIENNVDRVGWSVARALPFIQEKSFRQKLGSSLKVYSEKTDRELAENPFGVPWKPNIWGYGWDIQSFAVERYFLLQAFPELFDREPILRALNYALGCHPGSDISLVSGVGARSLTIGYGINRADWSYIPGMNVSGPALIRPDFPELKDNFPFLWQQAENVIGGAATYIFIVLATDELLNQEKSR